LTIKTPQYHSGGGEGIKRKIRIKKNGENENKNKT